MRSAALLSLVSVGACTGVIAAGDEGGGAPGGVPVSPTSPAANSTGPAATLPPGAAPAATLPGAPAACKTAQVGPAPLRRLTRDEYNNTIRDLLGDTSSPGNRFPSEDVREGFANDVAGQSVSQLLVENLQQAAEEVAARANLASVAGCTPASAAAEDGCLQQLIQRLGKRAFRRPVKSDETAALTAVFRMARADLDFAGAAQTVIAAILQSPQFLYRIENTAAAPVAGLVPLGGYEMASRLSYTFWGTMPDDALFAAADAGQLVTREQVAQQARRLVASPRAQPVLASFYAQWLGINNIRTVSKDKKTYPEFTPALGDAMLAETQAFASWVQWEGDGKLQSLLTAPVAFVNTPLAKIYGLADPGSATAPKRVTVDPAQRSGILSLPGMMSVLATTMQSDPIRRGKFVRVQLLCQALPPPPPDVMAQPPELRAGATTRQRYQDHSANPACHPCHNLIDPIGFGFESYDGIGRFRTVENGGLPIDNLGELAGSRDADGTFRGAPELGKRLAASAEVGDCVARQWFRYASGRMDTAADACTLQTLGSAFAASGRDLRELLIAATQTDGFRFRPAM